MTVTFSTPTEDYNLFDQVTWLRSTCIPAGEHTITGDPEFVSSSPQSSGDFKLSGGSPAIGSGANLEAPYNLLMDPDGTAFPYRDVDQNAMGCWERGAFAYR
jgi:hypothetical protein